jgi:hypothetical protein
MRTIVYIDGFNLYYRMLQNRPRLKWVNLFALCQRLLAPQNQIIKINYYTAHVSGRLDPDAPRRQRLYLDALRSTPLVVPHFGSFLEKPKYAGLYKPKLDARNRDNKQTFLGWPDVVYVWKTEEKGSDVNLASHLMLDACKDNFEVAAVLSNDSDLVEPIKLATQVLKKPVGLLSPVKNPTPHLSAAASFIRRIHVSDIATCLFPDPVALPHGQNIQKPITWV